MKVVVETCFQDPRLPAYSNHLHCQECHIMVLNHALLDFQTQADLPDSPQLNPQLGLVLAPQSQYLVEWEYFLRHLVEQDLEEAPSCSDHLQQYFLTWCWQGLCRGWEILQCFCPGYLRLSWCSAVLSNHPDWQLELWKQTRTTNLEIEAQTQM